MQFILNLNSITNKNISYEEFIKELSKDLNVNEINANELYIYTVKDGYSFYKLNKNSKTKNEDEIKFNIKRNELEKYKRALKRLEDLYLFSEDSISNKDYILRKKEIENNIEKLKKELIIKNEIIEEINYELVYTILYNIILKKIDNKEAINMLGRETLREFFTSFIKEIEVKDRKVIKLTFKNGLIVGFS